MDDSNPPRKPQFPEHILEQAELAKQRASAFDPMIAEHMKHMSEVSQQVVGDLHYHAKLAEDRLAQIGMLGRIASNAMEAAIHSVASVNLDLGISNLDRQMANVGELTRLAGVSAEAALHNINSMVDPELEKAIKRAQEQLAGGAIAGIEATLNNINFTIDPELEGAMKRAQEQLAGGAIAGIEATLNSVDFTISPELGKAMKRAQEQLAGAATAALGLEKSLGPDAALGLSRDYSLASRMAEIATHSLESRSPLTPGDLQQVIVQSYRDYQPSLTATIDDETLDKLAHKVADILEERLKSRSNSEQSE